MSWFSSAIKSVGKAIGSATKVVGGLAQAVVKAVPVANTIYSVATDIIGVDPIAAITNTASSLVSGGNIGSDIASGLKDSLTGGLISLIMPSKVAPGDSLPETSTDPPGVYTYEDGSYAYTVTVDGKVVFNPSDMSNPAAATEVVQQPNGSLSPIPPTLAGKAEYVKSLLDSYGNPLGVDKVNMTLSAVNNYVSGSEPLSGAQQSNLIALDVVGGDPELLSYTSQALAQATGKSAIDWSVILSGVYSVARNANIPGVSDAVKKAESQVVGAINQAATESLGQKIGSFISKNLTLCLGGAAGVVLLIVFLSGRRN